MKKQLARILIGLLLLLVAMYVEHTMSLPMWQLMLVYLVPYLVVGCDIIYEAMARLVGGKPLDEHLLTLVASVGVFGIGFFPGSSPELHEAVLVLLLFQVGELFERYAEWRSRRSIAQLVSMRPGDAGVQAALGRKSRSEAFITRFARIYTPVVVAVAVAVAFLPPLLYASYAEGFRLWLYRSLTFLVVSCPCALVISVPLSFFGGIGCASRGGILVKGAQCMDQLARATAPVPQPAAAAGADRRGLWVLPSSMGGQCLIADASVCGDAQIAAADVVITGGDVAARTRHAVRIARHTISIARQNVVFAIGVKMLVLLLAAFGMAAMWMAVFADVGVTVLAVLNAMRTMR